MSGSDAPSPPNRAARGSAGLLLGAPCRALAGRAAPRALHGCEGFIQLASHSLMSRSAAPSPPNRAARASAGLLLGRIAERSQGEPPAGLFGGVGLASTLFALAHGCEGFIPLASHSLMSRSAAPSPPNRAARGSAGLLLGAPCRAACFAGTMRARVFPDFMGYNGCALS